MNLLLDLNMFMFSLPLPSLWDQLIIIQGKPLDQDQLVPLLLLPKLLYFILLRLYQYSISSFGSNAPASEGLDTLFAYDSTGFGYETFTFKYTRETFTP
jgi:hypothetical protein